MLKDLNEKYMAKAYEFLANGFEDIEALVPVDILRRGGVEVKTVSISDSLMVESANGIIEKLTFYSMKSTIFQMRIY